MEFDINFFVNEIRCMQEYLLKTYSRKMFYSKRVKVFGYTRIVGINFWIVPLVLQ